jgi:hypothetical protein
VKPFNLNYLCSLAVAEDRSSGLPFCNLLQHFSSLNCRSKNFRTKGTIFRAARLLKQTLETWKWSLNISNDLDQSFN